MRTPHTHCYRGKKVVITLRDGTRFVDHYVEHKARHIVLEAAGRVRVDNLRAFSIWRGQDYPHFSQVS